MELWQGINGAKEGTPTKGRKKRRPVKPRVQFKDTLYTIVDPLHRDTIKPTDGGDIVPDPRTGYFTTHDPTLASELKARYPHMLVTQHERLQGDPTKPLLFSGIGEGKKSDEEMIADGYVKEGVRWIRRTYR